MVKCEVFLPDIPKDLAFSSFNNLNIRRKWDEVLQNMTIVEENKEAETTIFHYFLPTPVFVDKREALVLKKVKKDFPQVGALAIHSSSKSHPDYPEKKEFIRVELKINGMIFYDAPEINGCKIDWVIQNDIKGSVPKSIFNQKAIKNPKIMMEALSKYC